MILYALVVAANAVSANSHLDSGAQLLARGSQQQLHKRFQLLPRQNSAAAQSSPAANDDDSEGQAQTQTSSTQSLTSASVTQASSSSRSTGGGLLSDVSNILNPASSTSTEVSTSSPLPTTSSTTSEAQVVSTSSEVVSSSEDVDVENVTVISTIQFTQSSETSSSSASQASSESQNSKTDDSPALSKTTIIIIVVVASCVGGAIAIWTIVRKIKLSPSSRFDRKLAPVDFGVGRRDSDIYDGSQVNFATSPSNRNIVGAEPWPVHRSPSVASSHNSDGIKRAPSNGAAHMLNRTGSPDYRSDQGHGPAMSEVGYNAVYPSLPPQSHSYQNLYTQPAQGLQGYDGSGYNNYNVGYSASTRRPNY